MSTKTPYELRFEIVKELLSTIDIKTLPPGSRMDSILSEADKINQFVSGTYKPVDPAAQVAMQDLIQNFKKPEDTKKPPTKIFNSVGEVSRELAMLTSKYFGIFRDKLVTTLNDVAAETFKADQVDEDTGNKMTFAEFHKKKSERIEKLGNRIDSLDLLSKEFTNRFYSIRYNEGELYSAYDKWLLASGVFQGKQVWHEAVLNRISSDLYENTGIIHYQMPRRSGTTSGIWLMASYLISEGKSVYIVCASAAQQKEMEEYFKNNAKAREMLSSLTYPKGIYDVLFVDNVPAASWKTIKAKKTVVFTNVEHGVSPLEKKPVHPANNILLGAVKNLLCQLPDNSLCTSAQDQKFAIQKMISDLEDNKTYLDDYGLEGSEI